MYFKHHKIRITYTETSPLSYSIFTETFPRRILLNLKSKEDIAKIVIVTFLDQWLFTFIENVNCGFNQSTSVYFCLNEPN